MLAADIPSGIDGLTGAELGRAFRAQRTVTFQALKPGLLLAAGHVSAGRVEVADIGLDVSAVAAHRVETADVASWVPQRPSGAHKWQSACWVIAGSPGMTGAAHLRRVRRCGRVRGMSASVPPVDRATIGRRSRRCRWPCPPTDGALRSMVTGSPLR